MYLGQTLAGAIETAGICYLCERELACSLNIQGMEGLPLVQCSECGVVITSPRPTEAAISGWYPEDYYAHVSRTRG